MSAAAKKKKRTSNRSSNSYYGYMQEEETSDEAKSDEELVDLKMDTVLLVAEEEKKRLSPHSQWLACCERILQGCPEGAAWFLMHLVDIAHADEADTAKQSLSKLACVLRFDAPDTTVEDKEKTSTSTKAASFRSSKEASAIHPNSIGRRLVACAVRVCGAAAGPSDTAEAVAQTCAEALSKFVGLVVDKLAVFCEPPPQPSTGMNRDVLSNHDTDEDEDTNDQTQWSTEMLRCQLWVRQVLFTCFSSYGNASPAIYSGHAALVTRLARGLAFSGSQDGDHDNVKGARGGQWSAAVLVSSFDLLAILLGNAASRGVCITDDLLVTSLVGVGTFEHHDIAQAAERYIDAMHSAFPAQCIQDFCTNGSDVVMRAMDVADMTTIRPIFGFVRALVDVSTGAFGGVCGRSGGGVAAVADDPVLGNLMRSVLHGIRRNSVLVWRETLASMHGVLELCRCNHFVAEWCSERVNISSVGAAGPGGKEEEEEEGQEDSALFEWWDSFFEANPDSDQAPDCAKQMRKAGSATPKMMLYGHAVLRSSGASRVSAGTGMPRSLAKRTVVDNYNSYNSYNSYNNSYYTRRPRRGEGDYRKKKDSIGCVDPNKTSVLETLQQMRAWRLNKEDVPFGGGTWQEPMAVHCRPPSWSSGDVAMEGFRPLLCAKSLVARRAVIKWDDGSYECSIVSWDPLTGEHKCVFDDGDTKCYNLYRRWGVKLLPRGSLPPANSKVPAHVHQADYAGQLVEKVDAGSGVMNRSTGKARVMQTGHHSSDEDSEDGFV